MRKVIVRDYQPEDFLRLKALVMGSDKNDGIFALMHEKAGPAFTFLADDGRLLACGGIDLRWKGCGELWGVFSPKAAGYLSLGGTLKSYLDSAQRAGSITRIQAAVECDRPTHIRFAEWLGFKREGRMVKFMFKRDYFLYARVMEDCDG
jgi:RimJ/RimL family protein N-acetyltransferase